jgi:anhydro-N-acetylmuramic acid kinase
MRVNRGHGIVLFLGLMSGTSVDGIDAALVDFTATSPQVVGCQFTPYDTELRDQLISLAHRESTTFDDLYRADVRLGRSFAGAANKLIESCGIDRGKIGALGSHGQTIRHRPNGPDPYTVQIGDPNVIAQLTGLTTVADFRRRDVAAGGQGAPLAPIFHAAVLTAPGRVRAIVNIGGIANVSFLDGRAALQAGGAITEGFDTGPGNGLMDAWIGDHDGARLDTGGTWARSGELNEQLLERFLSDPFFAQPGPKSTGREYFNLRWVQDQFPDGLNVPASHIQRTLCELTARSIADAIGGYPSDVDEVLVCGGGVHNALLMEQLSTAVHPVPVASTAQAGIEPDWVEAIAFAWLAKQTIEGKPGNNPTITGASDFAVLGAIHAPSL